MRAIMSPSVRKVWIEIKGNHVGPDVANVTFRDEGVD